MACFTEEKLLGEQQRKGFGAGKAKSNRTHPSLFFPEQGGAALCCQPLLKPPLGHFLSRNSSLTCGGWAVETVFAETHRGKGSYTLLQDKMNALPSLQE